MGLWNTFVEFIYMLFFKVYPNKFHIIPFIFVFRISLLGIDKIKFVKELKINNLQSHHTFNLSFLGKFTNTNMKVFKT